MYNFTNNNFLYSIYSLNSINAIIEINLWMHIFVWAFHSVTSEWAACVETIILVGILAFSNNAVCAHMWENTRSYCCSYENVNCVDCDSNKIVRSLETKKKSPNAYQQSAEHSIRSPWMSELARHTILSYICFLYTLVKTKQSFFSYKCTTL